MNVLIADDNPRAAQELGMLLRDLHCTIVGHVRHSDDLMLRAGQWQPDLIMLNVSLRGAYHPVIALRRLAGRYPQTRLVVTGALSESSSLMEALSEGAHDILTRPYRRSGVSECLQMAR